MSRIFIDANVILRYLLNDVDLLSRKAAKVLETKSTFLPIEVACEIVYVLESVYSVNRNDIFVSFTRLFNTLDITTSYPGVLFEGLSLFHHSTFDSSGIK